MLNHDCHICKILLSCVSEGSPGKQAPWDMLSHAYREGRIYHTGFTPSWRHKVPLSTCSPEPWAPGGIVQSRPAGLGTGGSHSASPSLRQENTMSSSAVRQRADPLLPIFVLFKPRGTGWCLHIDEGNLLYSVC